MARTTHPLFGRRFDRDVGPTNPTQPSNGECRAGEGADPVSAERGHGV